MLLALASGLGAASSWAVGTVFSARATRSVGAFPALAVVMLTGLVLLAPWCAAAGAPSAGALDVAWLALGGCGNVLGLLLTYHALRIGDLGVVTPLVSAEGGVASLIAILAGAPVSLAQGFALGAVLVGMALTGGAGRRGQSGGGSRAAAGWAAAASVSFGAGLYGTARASAALPLMWAVLPPRLVGVVVITVPLMLARGPRLKPRAGAAAAAAGALEVVGFLCFGFGSRHSVVVTAIFASLTGALAAVFGALLFGERLRRLQLAGIAAIVVGVAALTAVSTS